MNEYTESQILRKYYAENDFVLSPEGILKIISVIVCIVSAVLFLGGAGAACGAQTQGAGARALAASGATVSLVAAALLALLYAGAACALPLYAPVAWLYTDIVLCAVMGVLLLLTAVLSITFCQMSSVVDYMHGPLSIVSACAVTASAGLTYAAAMRRLDAARAPATQPRNAPPGELDV